MVKYRIPLDDKDALSKLRKNKDVTSWTIILPDNIAIVEVKKEIKDLEKYKI